MHRFYQKSETGKSPSGQRDFEIETAKKALLTARKEILKRKQIYNTLVKSLEISQEKLQRKTKIYEENPSESLKEEIVHLRDVINHCHDKLNSSHLMEKISEMEEQYETYRKKIKSLSEQEATGPESPR